MLNLALILALLSGVAAIMGIRAWSESPAWRKVLTVILGWFAIGELIVFLTAFDI